MDRFTRIFKLHQLLGSRRLPVSHKTVEDELQCSRATATRVIQEMRDYLGAPIEYDRERNGYFYEKTGGHFQTVAGAVLQRRRLAIRYHGRSADRVTDREISPQRIAHYRDNWYLDAWCHQADGLRTFAPERLRQEVAARLRAAAGKYD